MGNDSYADAAGRGRGRRPSVAARRQCLVGLAGLILITVATSPPALAKPDWAEDFEEKAAGWKERADAALKRLEEAAKAARDKLDQVMKERADELERVLKENRDALDAVMKEQDAAWAAVVAERFEQITATADALSTDLDAIAAGTGRFVRGEVSRLTVGLRQSVTEGLRQANVQLGELEVVDRRVIAAARSGTQSSLKRWQWILLSVVGALFVLVGVPLAQHHDRFLALAFLLIGLGAAGFGIYRLSATGNEAQPMALGLTECPALAEAHDFLVRAGPTLAPQARPAAAALRGQLARCQALAADDTLAQLAAVQLKRLHVLTTGK